MKRLKVENRSVRISGRFPALRDGLIRLGAYVGGELSASTDVELRDGALDASIELDPRHLDGHLRSVEVRLLPDEIPVAFTYTILPSKVTPWTALQAYAGNPLDVAASPAATYHLRNFRSWVKALEGGLISSLPPLGSLQDELLGGFRKRARYPRLSFPKIDAPTASVVIPVHDKFEVTYLCLASLLFAFNRTSFEVIIVDDGSTDETLRLSEIVEGVKVIRHEQPGGFVQSCNDGAARAVGEFVTFLNNDTEVTPGWLDELVETFSSFENVGLAGSRLLYPDGRLQEAGGIVWRSGNPWNVGRGGNANEPQFNYTRQVDYLSGAAICLPRDLWTQVGEFSAEFAPGYFEDTDLAMKVRNAGRLVVYVPSSTVFHFEGQSAGTSTQDGMKRFQEVNRPKFKRKWARLYAGHGEEGVRADREKDRNISFRVLFIDQRFPSVDADAGSYSAFQEIRLLQAMGAKVTFLPRNLAWMDRHTLALQRLGAECLYAPFVLDFMEYVSTKAAEFDVIYVDRYRIAEQIVDTIRRSAPKAKIVFNLVDLHFLRELREAAAETPGCTFERAQDTRATELAMIRACDLTLTYSDVEMAVISSHMDRPTKVAKVPWVVETTEQPRPSFAETRDLLFLGGFGHPPNVHAVRFFVEKVLPGLLERIPGIVFRIVGSNPTPEVLALRSDSVVVEGYVEKLDDVFSTSRIFVVPLLAGAGIKGKVLEAMARGATMVVSAVAAEATGLTHGHSAMVVRTADEWVEVISQVYLDEAMWDRLGNNAKQLAESEFSFQKGLSTMRDALASIEVYGSEGLVYRHARPHRYGYLPAVAGAVP